MLVCVRMQKCIFWREEQREKNDRFYLRERQRVSERERQRVSVRERDREWVWGRDKEWVWGRDKEWVWGREKKERGSKKFWFIEGSKKQLFSTAFSLPGSYYPLLLIVSLSNVEFSLRFSLSLSLALDRIRTREREREMCSKKRAHFERFQMNLLSSEWRKERGIWGEKIVKIKSRARVGEESWFSIHYLLPLSFFIPVSFSLSLLIPGSFSFFLLFALPISSI